LVGTSKVLTASILALHFFLMAGGVEMTEDDFNVEETEMTVYDYVNAYLGTDMLPDGADEI